jgi:hypothetical protein
MIADVNLCVCLCYEEGLQEEQHCLVVNAVTTDCVLRTICVQGSPTCNVQVAAVTHCCAADPVLLAAGLHRHVWRLLHSQPDGGCSACCMHLCSPQWQI